MKCCGCCAKSEISKWTHNLTCLVSGKDVGYLQVFDCFKPKEDMEQNEKPTPQPEAEVQKKEEPVARKTKVCKHCGQELPVEYFSKNARAKDGLQNYCKDCQKDTIRVSRAKQKEVAERWGEGGGKGAAEEDGRKQTWDKKREDRGFLASIPDSELITELKRRGYFGKIYKRVEVVL